MELKLKNINVCNFSDQLSTNCNVEADIIVPDTKPDIYKILCVNALASVGEHYIRKGKIVFSGSVKFNVLYTGDTDKGRIYCIEYQLPFNHQADIAGAEDDYISAALCTVASTDFRIKNSRKLSAMCSLKIDADISNYKAMDVIEDITDGDLAPVKKCSYKSDSLLACKSFSISLSDTITLSNGDSGCEILDFSASVASAEIKSVNNKAIVKGSVPAKIFYIAGSEPATCETEINFTEIIDLDMASSDSVLHPHIDVCDITYELTESEEETSLDFDVKLGGYIKAFEKSEYSLVSDIYSPDYSYSADKMSTTAKTVSNLSEAQLTLKDTLQSAMGKGISKVYYMSVYPVCTKITPDISSVKVSGNVQTTVIYADEESELSSTKKDIPFDIDIAVDTSNQADSCFASVSTPGYGYVLGGSNEIQARIILKASAATQSGHEVTVISDFSEDKSAPIDKSAQPSITVCYPDSSMSLWDYAVKYHTTVDDIARLNSIDPDTVPEKGTPLLIAKRKKL